MFYMGMDIDVLTVFDWLSTISLHWSLNQSKSVILGEKVFFFCHQKAIKDWSHCKGVSVKDIEVVDQRAPEQVSEYH